MIGKVHIFNKNTSRIVKSIKFEELIHNEELKHNLRDNYLNKDSLVLCCGCNKQIELGIDTLGRIYHKKKDDVHKHNKYCNKHPNYRDNIEVDGWKESDNSPFVVASIKLKNNINNCNIINKNSLSIDMFVKLLNIYSWNHFIYKNYSFPKNKYEFLNKIFGISNFIKLENFNNNTLNNYFFNVSSYKKIKTNEIKFTYMYLKKIDIDIEKNIVSITGEYSKNKTFTFTVNRKLFTQKYMKVKRKSDTRSPLVIAGFINKKNNNFEFIDFTILKINYYGVFCKNDYEKNLFDMFCNNDILFTIPYKAIPIYNGNKPTAILVGGDKKEIFVEIFDSDSKEALLKREHTIELFETNLNNTHKLVRWDVFNTRKLPSLTYIKMLLRK